MADVNKPRRQRTPGLEGMQSIIQKTVSNWGQRQRFYVHMMLWHWREIAGDYVADNCQPQGVRKQVLYLYCPNAALRNELQLMRLRLLEEINGFVGWQMIKEIAFSRPWANPETAGMDVLLAPAPPARNFGKELQQMPLTPAEIERSHGLAELAEDKEIGQKAGELYRKYRQMQKLRLKDGWHPCQQCGHLTEPEKKLCFRCEIERRERINAGVRQVLREMPWARYHEISSYVPECTPRIVNTQRAFLVGQLASEVEVMDFKSLKAKNLVMLYRCLPPEQLTDEVIRRTLYYLRNYLHKPKDYKAPKRYDVIPLGKRQRHKGDK